MREADRDMRQTRPKPPLAQRPEARSLWAGALLLSLTSLSSAHAAGDAADSAQKAAEKNDKSAANARKKVQGSAKDQSLGVLTYRELAAVQKPLYSPQGMLEVGLQSAILPADVYVFSTSLGAQGTLHLNERLGLELNAQYSWGFETYASRTLREQGIRVDAWSPLTFVTLDAVYAPIYAKLNLMGQQILHFDVAVVGGAGLFVSERTLYNDVNAADGAARFSQPVSLNAGLLHRYYVRILGHACAVRLDARDHLTLMQTLDGAFWLKHNLLLGLGFSTFLPTGKAGGGS